MNKTLTSILKAFLATLLYIIGIELISLCYLIEETIDFENYDRFYYLIQGSLQLIGVLIFMFIIRKRTFKHLIKTTHYKWYLFAGILGISFVFLQTPLKWVYNLIFDTEYSIAYRFDGFPKFKDINWISIIMFIPIGEELFFRGYIQNNLQKKTNAVVAILLTSILFASIHAPYLNLIFEFSKQDWHSFYLTFFGGLIAGLLYLKSKSLGPSMIFHMSWNLMVMIV
ncbi:CPBP family intramembrane glutamic endopeptidase [Aureivirga sp. CE67]|uniref:CPBP family intramembrane glutamic endopeptidase n=1 Tax=Aureivirga sp. CE67 TaxID=1788983 RepID=UPI0018C97E78|nr:type II CAAX endopeptidase family protein [Aureivirga sp. CE67]